MTTNPAWIKVDPEHIADILQRQAVEQLMDGAQNEVVLDFSAVLRIDGHAVQALEELAGRAHERSIKIVLRAVRIDVYRVLKLLGLAQRFCFVT